MVNIVIPKITCTKPITFSILVMSESNTSDTRSANTPAEQNHRISAGFFMSFPFISNIKPLSLCSV